MLASCLLEGGWVVSVTTRLKLGGHKRGDAKLFLHWYACMEIFYPLARICHMMISNHASQLTRLTTQLRPRMVNSV